MMLMLLLSELTRLGVHLSAEPDGLWIKAPAGVLTGDLRQAMMTAIAKNIDTVMIERVVKKRA